MPQALNRIITVYCLLMCLWFVENNNNDIFVIYIYCTIKAELTSPSELSSIYSVLHLFGASCIQHSISFSFSQHNHHHLHQVLTFDVSTSLWVSVTKGTSLILWFLTINLKMTSTSSDEILYVYLKIIAAILHLTLAANKKIPYPQKKPSIILSENFPP